LQVKAIVLIAARVLVVIDELDIAVTLLYASVAIGLLVLRWQRTQESYAYLR
jgi:hypothetical protein